MGLIESFRVALDALRANRLRSLLTMLGVIIGVGAVVMLVAIGSGAKREVEQQVQGLGSNLILIVPGEFDFGAARTVRAPKALTSTPRPRAWAHSVDASSVSAAGRWKTTMLVCTVARSSCTGAAAASASASTRALAWSSSRRCR